MAYSSGVLLLDLASNVEHLHANWRLQRWTCQPVFEKPGQALSSPMERKQRLNYGTCVSPTALRYSSSQQISSETNWNTSNCIMQMRDACKLEAQTLRISQDMNNKLWAWYTRKKKPFRDWGITWMHSRTTSRLNGRNGRGRPHRLQHTRQRFMPCTPNFRTWQRSGVWTLRGRR